MNPNYYQIEHYAYGKSSDNVAVPVDIGIDWSKIPTSISEITAKSTTGATRTFRRPQPLTLTITPQQAQALAEVFHRIGGDPNTTMRGRIDELNRKLQAAGYRGTDSTIGWSVSTPNPACPATGAIHFTK